MRTSQGRTGHLLRQDRSGEHACFIYGTIAEAGSTRTSVPVVLIDGLQNPGGGRRAASSIQTAGSLLLLKVHILNFVTGLLIIIGKTEDGVLSLVIGQDGVALIERSLL